MTSHLNTEFQILSINGGRISEFNSINRLTSSQKIQPVCDGAGATAGVSQWNKRRAHRTQVSSPETVRLVFFLQ